MSDITRLHPFAVSVDDVTTVILVADDDAANRAFVEHVLKRAGYIGKPFRPGRVIDLLYRIGDAKVALRLG